MQIGIQTKSVEDLTAVADFIRNNNVPLLFVVLLLLQFLSMVIDRSVDKTMNYVCERHFIVILYS